MTQEDRILTFVGGVFRSVWAIEVLRFLTQHFERPHTPDELVAELRVSNSVISQSIAQLTAVGLATMDDNGLIRFHPATEELACLGREAVELYERRPGQVRRTIISHTTPGIAAFSDAFKLRKD